MMHGVPANLKAMQVLVLSLLMGMVTMTGVFISLNTSRSSPASGTSDSSVLVYALAGLAVVATIPLSIVPQAMRKRASAGYRAATSESEREAVAIRALGVVTILKCAIVQGVGMFGAVIFMLTGMWSVLAAPALAAMVLVGLIPTAGKLAAFREQLQRTGM